MKLLALLMLTSLALTAKPIYIPGASCAYCHIDAVSSRRYLPKAVEMRKLHQGDQCQGCHVSVNGKVTLKPKPR